MFIKFYCHLYLDNNPETYSQVLEKWLPVIKKALSVKQAYSKKFKKFEFEGIWQEVFGNPETTGGWIIHGDEKQGKSTFALMLANYLTKFGKVLYISAEEGISEHFTGAMKRMGINDTNKNFKIKDESGNIVPYDRFEQKILKLNEQYNRHYLEAEYQFAVHSAQSAANWANLQENTSRYWLEYRTAGDERVRANHAVLNGICLPKDDDFWTEYYPPNGWRCRCVAVEVLARENTLSDSKKAKELGEKATTHIAPNGKNKLQMFRFNPGAEKKVFPPNNAYNKVVGAEQAEKTLKQQIDYKKVSIQELETMYKNQNINTKNEEIIMNDGYVATANSFFINERLRTDKPLSDHDKKIVDALDSLINTNKLKDNYIFYRNVRNDFIEATFGVVPSKNISETIDEIKRTNIASYSDKGFTSVSAIKTENAFKSRPIHLEIRAKKGTKAIVTSNFEESEIILGRNQKMNLIDILEENEKIKFIVETD